MSLVERMMHYVFPGAAPQTLQAATTTLGNEDNNLLLTAVTPGPSGNLISFQYFAGVGASQPYSIAVVGNAIRFTSATDVGGGSNSGTADIAAAIAGSPAASALVTTTIIVAGGGFDPFGPQFLTGGSSVGLAGSTSQLGLQLKLDSDAPFRISGVCLWNLNVAGRAGFDGQVSIRFTRPDGRYVQKLLTSSNLLFPGNQYNTGGLANKALVSRIFPSYVYPASSTITIDIQGLPDAAGPGFVLVFVGTKLFEHGSIWAPDYPAAWRGLPYLDNLTVSQLDITAFPSLNHIFTAQKDADFVWQAGAYSDACKGTPAGSGGGTIGAGIGQLVDLGVIVRDCYGKPYSNGYVPAALLFNFLGAEAPGWLYPEIYIPKNQQLSFDLNYLYAGFGLPLPLVNVTLGLKGMKVYAQ